MQEISRAFSEPLKKAQFTLCVQGGGLCLLEKSLQSLNMERRGYLQIIGEISMPKNVWWNIPYELKGMGMVSILMGVEVDE